MKKSFKTISIALFTILSITACVKRTNDDKIIEHKDINSTTKEVKKDISFNNKKLSKLYNKILDNVDSYTFFDSTEKTTVTYSYALVNMNTSDFPQLLVSQNSNYGLSYIKFFSSNEDFTKEITSDEIITIGVAPAGGFRGGINQNETLDSLIYTSFYSGNGDCAEEKISSLLENNKLTIKRKVYWKGKINKLPKKKVLEINFIDISDRKKLENLAKTPDMEFKKSNTKTNDTEKNINKNDTNSLQSSIKSEQDKGKMVVEGVVKIFNHEELKAFQKLNPKILPNMKETYVVLVMKDYVDVNMISGGYPGKHYYKRKVNLISLPKDMIKYKNQNITISFTKDDGHWQSDVSLPMNAPRMHKVNVLN